LKKLPIALPAGWPAWDKDGKPMKPDFEPSIGVVKMFQGRKMGPLWVRGGIPIEAEDGTRF